MAEKLLPDAKHKKFPLKLFIYLGVGIVSISVGIYFLMANFLLSQGKIIEIPLSEAIGLSQKGNVTSAIIKESSLELKVNIDSVHNTDGQEVLVRDKDTVLTRIGNIGFYGIKQLGFELPDQFMQIASSEKGGTNYISSLFLILIVGGVAVYLAHSAGLFGGIGKKVTRGDVLTFNDIGGLSSIKPSLEEMVSFLRNPHYLDYYNAHIPRGILLVGPPGTGKTMLAKAVAGEAKVPFYHANGSDFVQQFIGMGSLRVRVLFNKAKRHQPCVVFIDEIDAIAGKRMYTGSGGDHEYNQTVSALLSVMDGFVKTNVLILAATNNPEMLDEAILRPGRFDRRLELKMPTVEERIDIFNLYLKPKPVSSDIDINQLAEEVGNYSGAQISALVNEAAIMASKRNAPEITMQDFKSARCKIIDDNNKLAIGFLKK